MQTREHILTAFDDVAEPRVVDDHRVEALNVERALSGGRHRQEVRFFLFSLEKGPNDPDRLATVIEGAIDTRKALPDQLRRLLYTGTSR